MIDPDVRELAELCVKAPLFTTAIQVENEVARIGGELINRYVFYLGQEVGMGYGPGVAAPDKLFALRRATPQQISRAFLEAIK